MRSQRSAAGGAALPGDSALNAARRSRELAEATDGRTVDLVVIGLGATGAGVALDAASRGLSVVGVDAHDLAFGTSRWSSKLVHGGLRYLAQGQFGVAYESAIERGILMSRTAPHLTRPLPMLIPMLPTVSRAQASTALGALWAGDVLRAAARTSRHELPRPRRMSDTETLALVPGLRRGGLRGGLLSWDGQLEDDARLVVALARTAAAHGARILTRTRVLVAGGEGVSVRDELTGAVAAISSRAVVNAAGVWSGDLVPGISLRPSRGTHLVLRRQSLGSPAAAVMAPVPGESTRFVFALPQPDGLVYVGVTDELVDGPVPDVPVPTDAEVDFLLGVIGTAFERPLSRADVVGAYAGLRPLLEAEGRTADLSRRHTVITAPSGVITVTGGKLTTYRRMAQDAVDAAVRLRGLPGRSCRTAYLPLVGAAPRSELLRVDAPTRLVRRYGTEAPLVAAGPSSRERIAPGVPVTHAELQFGLTHEGALDVDDLLDRRTRVGLVPADRAASAAAARAALSTV